jgi:hypothetical protein
MSSGADSGQAAQAGALAAFKQDCDENGMIAGLLRGKLRGHLVPPVLDVGAGSGAIADAGFPDLKAFLLDLDEYKKTNANHERIRDDFMKLDFSTCRPNTILFCHSLYYLSDDMDALRLRLQGSGARTALVVANERDGMLWRIAQDLRALAPPSHLAFYAPVPELNASKLAGFSAELASRDFATLARHVAFLLQLPPSGPILDVLARHLDAVLDAPRLGIDEAVYCYELDEQFGSGRCALNER